MPRTLPWLVEEGTPKPKRTHNSSTSIAAKVKPTREQDDSEDLVDSDLNPLHPSPPPKKKRRLDRTPSTSPPPAPSSAPEVEYMKEGYHADDIWRMVEDEFYFAAQAFTQHIHRAEYVRLKKLAKSRGAGTLRSIARATDGKTKQSEELSLKVEAEKLMKRRRAAARADGSDEESSSGDSDDYMQDPQLAGLMVGKTRSGEDLTTIVNAQAKTRAAAGFSQSPKNTERYRNVTGTIASSSKAPTTLEPKVGRKEKGAKSYPSKSSGPTTIFKEFARKESNVDQNGRAHSDAKPPHSSSGKSSIKSRMKLTDTTLSDVGELPDTKESARDYLAKKRADKERKEREEKRKAKMADSIPTFLF